MTPELERRVKSMQLRDLLNGMNVPSFRMQQMNDSNLRWLSRNLAINNAPHPDLNNALDIIKSLLKKG